LTHLPPWQQQILIDATNPFHGRAGTFTLADVHGLSTSQFVAQLAPGAKVVKAINHMLVANFEAGGDVNGAKRVAFVSADDADAKTTVGALLRTFGFAVIDLGNLRDGGLIQQAGGPLAGRFCRKVRFLGKIQKSGVRNSMTYRLPNSRKSNFGVSA
jgi:predicted dinucleotide-binding enzyme